MSKKTKSAKEAEMLAKAKAAEEEEGDEDGQEDGEDEEDEGMEKGIAVEDLEKGLAELEAASRAKPSRRDQLFEKAKKNRLTSLERKELSSILEPKSLAKSLEDDSDLVKAMDVSPALDTLGAKVSEAIDGLTDRLEKSISEHGDFNEAVAKTLISMGTLLKALSAQNDEFAAKLDEVLDSPARAPKAEGKPLAKALERTATTTGTESQPAKLQTKQVAPIIERMFMESQSTDTPGYSPSGASLKTELSKALSNFALSPNMVKDLTDFAKAKGIGAA